MVGRRFADLARGRYRSAASRRSLEMCSVPHEGLALAARSSAERNRDSPRVDVSTALLTHIQALQLQAAPLHRPHRQILLLAAALARRCWLETPRPQLPPLQTRSVPVPVLVPVLVLVLVLLQNPAPVDQPGDMMAAPLACTYVHYSKFSSPSCVACRRQYIRVHNSLCVRRYYLMY